MKLWRKRHSLGFLHGALLVLIGWNGLGDRHSRTLYCSGLRDVAVLSLLMGWLLVLSFTAVKVRDGQWGCRRWSGCSIWILKWGKNILHSVQFSSLTDWVIGGGGGGWGGAWGVIQQIPSSSLFCRGPLWADLAWTVLSTLWCCPSSICSANRCVLMVLESLSWHVTRPNHAGFCLLTVTILRFIG